MADRPPLEIKQASEGTEAEESAEIGKRGLFGAVFLRLPSWGDDLRRPIALHTPLVRLGRVFKI